MSGSASSGVRVVDSPSMLAVQPTTCTPPIFAPTCGSGVPRNTGPW